MRRMSVCHLSEQKHAKGIPKNLPLTGSTTNKPAKERFASRVATYCAVRRTLHTTYYFTQRDAKKWHCQIAKKTCWQIFVENFDGIPMQKRFQQQSLAQILQWRRVKYDGSMSKRCSRSESKTSTDLCKRRRRCTSLPVASDKKTRKKNKNRGKSARH